MTIVPHSARPLSALVLVHVFLTPLAPAQVPFKETAITTHAPGAVSILAVDLDGDGDTDVLSASSGDDSIRWFESDGSAPPSFTEHTISDTADFAKSVFAADVDGDGDTDVLSASLFDSRIAWYENDGASPPIFTTHTVATTAAGLNSVFAADVDGDGDTDVLSAALNDLIVWYENDGSIPPAFRSRVISSTADGAYSVFATDLDGDGDTDVLSASFLDDKIAWYENDGARPPTFRIRTITLAANSAYSVFAADVDGDGDTDVLSASRFDDEITWYENDGATPPAFGAHAISTVADGANSVFAVDVDGDGDTDVLSASEFDDRIAWYENDGARPPAFVAHTITATADAAHSVFAADVDGDGDTDVLSASGDDHKVAWYENQSAYLVPSTNRISISTGGIVTFQIDLPTSAANDLYQILGSASGPGSMRLGRLTVPLTFDKLTVRTLTGGYPAYAVGFSGRLDRFGDGFAFLAAAPGQLRPGLMGKSVHLAVVCRPVAGTWRYTTQSAPLTFDP